MRLLLLLASAAAISKVPKAPRTGRAAAISTKENPTTGRAAAKAQAEQAKPLALSGGAKQKQVSYAWAVLHNWLYFLSLGLCIPVLPKVIASTVNDDGAAVITGERLGPLGRIHSQPRNAARGLDPPPRYPAHPVRRTRPPPNRIRNL